jgi:hypothetical protein
VEEKKLEEGKNRRERSLDLVLYTYFLAFCVYVNGLYTNYIRKVIAHGPSKHVAGLTSDYSMTWL